MKSKFVLSLLGLLLIMAAFTVQADVKETNVAVVNDYDIYVTNGDGSICGGTYAGEPGKYYWDCWYPW